MERPKNIFKINQDIVKKHPTAVLIIKIWFFFFVGKELISLVTLTVLGAYTFIGLDFMLILAGIALTLAAAYGLFKFYFWFYVGLAILVPLVHFTQLYKPIILCEIIFSIAAFFAAKKVRKTIREQIST